MRKISVVLCSIFLALIGIFILAGTSRADDFEVAQFIIDPSYPTLEGSVISVTGEVVVSLGTPGLSLEVRPVVLLIKPRSFAVKGPMRFSVESSRPDFSNYFVQVTRGPAADLLDITKRKLMTDPKFGSLFERLDNQEYEWWLGMAKDLDFMGTDDKLYFSATVESGCVGTFEAYAVFGGVITLIDPEHSTALDSYKGSSRLSIVDSGTDQVTPGEVVGLPLTMLLGSVTDPVAVSDSGNIFAASSTNASGLGNNNGRFIASNMITLLNPDGSLNKDIYIPHNSEDPSPPSRDNYCPEMVAWTPNLSGRFYAACAAPAWFGGAEYGSIRVYNDDGVLQYDYDLDPFNLGIITDVRLAIAATKEDSSSNEVYVLSAGGNKLIIFHDSGASGAHESVVIPGGSARSLAIINRGASGEGLAVFARNNVFIYDSAEVLVDTVPATDETWDCEPSYFVDDPAAGKIYVARRVLNTPAHIWEINYRLPNPTVEAIYDMIDLFGQFALDPASKRLYVPVPPSVADAFGRIKIINLNTKSVNTVKVGGNPVSCAFANGKLYVSDIPISTTDYAIPPVEAYGYLVNVYTPSGSSLNYHGSLTVGHAPVNVAQRGNKIYYIASALPGILLNMGGTNEIKSDPAGTPEVRNVMINGGLIVNGDLISSNPILTADLYDDSGIFTAEVRVDGVKRNAAYAPLLPANTIHGPARLSLAIGNLSSAFTHSITIEASDGFNVGAWEVFGLRASGGGSIAIKGNYPAVYPTPFKPAAIKGSEGMLKIAYELTIDAPITIKIIDITGKPVFTRKYGAGGQGGRAGYNQVLWNGHSDTGGVIGNGIYLYKIFSKDKMIGDGKIVVYD